MDGEALKKVLGDPFGSTWPDSLVAYLNTAYDPEAEWVKRYKARVPNWREHLPWADPAVASRFRAQQKQVLAIVDFLLREKNAQKVATQVDRLLMSVQVTPALELRSRLGLPPGPNDTPFALRWWRWQRPPQRRLSGRAAQAWNRRLPYKEAAISRHHALVDLARLLDSTLWRSLRKCPACSTYFLAGAYRRKKYCSQRCMWRWLQSHYRARTGRGARGRSQARAPKRRREVLG